MADTSHIFEDVKYLQKQNTLFLRRKKYRDLNKDDFEKEMKKQLLIVMKVKQEMMVQDIELKQLLLKDLKIQKMKEWKNYMKLDLIVELNKKIWFKYGLIGHLNCFNLDQT